MSDITVNVSSPADSVVVSVPSSTTPIVSVIDGSGINVTISPDVALQNLVNLLDVSGTPADNQTIIYDADSGEFNFIDLASSGGGGSGLITSDLLVTNTDGAFDHIFNKLYQPSNNITTENILRNILAPPPAPTLTLTALSPTAGFSGQGGESVARFEVGNTSRPVNSIAFSCTSPQSLAAAGVRVRRNGTLIATTVFDPIIPTNIANTVYPFLLNGSAVTLETARTSYGDEVFDISSSPVNSLGVTQTVSSTKIHTIRYRQRHLLYGSTTELTTSSSEAEVQAVYDAIVSATSTLASEQLQDRADSYVYNNTGNRYNLDTANAYTYYFYPFAGQGALTDIKLGGSTGLDIDDSFIDISNGSTVNINNGNGVVAGYKVYRSSNKRAFTSDQSIYFAN